MELALNAASSSSGFTFDDFFQWGRDAVKDGTPFDSWTSGAIIVGYAISQRVRKRIEEVFARGHKPPVE